MDPLIQGSGKPPGDFRLRPGPAAVRPARATGPFPLMSTLRVVTTVVLAVAAASSCFLC